MEQATQAQASNLLDFNRSKQKKGALSEQIALATKFDAKAWLNFDILLSGYALLPTEKFSVRNARVDPHSSAALDGFEDVESIIKSLNISWDDWSKMLLAANVAKRFSSSQATPDLVLAEHQQVKSFLQREPISINEYQNALLELKQKNIADELRNSKSEITNLTFEINQLKKQNQSLAAEKDTLTKSLEKEKIDRELLINTHTQEVVQLKSKIHKLENQISMQKSTILDLEAKLELQKKHVNDLLDQNHTLNRLLVTHEELQQSYEASLNQIESLKSQLESNNIEADEVISPSHNINNLQKHNQQLQDELDKLQVEYEFAKNEHISTRDLLAKQESLMENLIQLHKSEIGELNLANEYKIKTLEVVIEEKQELSSAQGETLNKFNDVLVRYKKLIARYKDSEIELKKMLENKKSASNVRTFKLFIKNHINSLRSKIKEKL